MRSTIGETTRGGHGSVRYGPSIAGDGFPVPPELSRAVAAAATRAEGDQAGGGPELLDAACGYWRGRGLPTGLSRTAAAPGAAVLLPALSAALGGDVLVPRPCAAWWVPAVRLVGRRAFQVPTAAESGGVPDPYALLETVRRARAEGHDPRLLVVSIADDPTAAVAPPDVLYETTRVAVGEGLHLLSDETWRDTVHDPHQTVVVSPAEMEPERVTVVCDLAGAFLPPGWPAAVARFPATASGAGLRARVLDVLTALGARVATPVASAAAYALAEPEPMVRHRSVAVRWHARSAAAVHAAVVAGGALCRPPRSGRHLYPDLEPFREALLGHGVRDAQELEDFLTARLGVPTPGGHRFGDELGALRVRLSTGSLSRAAAEGGSDLLARADPLDAPAVREALSTLEAVLGDLRDTRREEPPR
ncbi:aminotransferase class I/II-fold pyridoxal phosphate-dependent enzyme [Streptomyces sp. ZYX-F-203]